jgi:hypothetical protein
VSANRVPVLKIDKDCFVDPAWLRDYIALILRICRAYNLCVKSIRMTRSKSKGQHFYIQIEPSVEPELANRLQWLLGDDCRRVDFNRARIRSHLPEFDKLFEEPNRRLRTLYRQPWFSTKGPFYVHER